VVPLLASVGGAATWGDAFMLVGSLAGQLLMVLQKTETWPVWIMVNTVGAVLYASQGLYFTSLFYAVLILMAVAGWRAWSARTPATTVASPAPAGA
jgi:nicotinamide mononucleotide transporter